MRLHQRQRLLLPAPLRQLVAHRVHEELVPRLGKLRGRPLLLELRPGQRVLRHRHQRLLGVPQPGVEPVEELPVGVRLRRPLVAQPPVRGRMGVQLRPRHQTHQLRVFPLQDLEHPLQDRPQRPLPPELKRTVQHLKAPPVHDEELGELPAPPQLLEQPALRPLPTRLLLRPVQRRRLLPPLGLPQLGRGLKAMQKLELGHLDVQNRQPLQPARRGLQRPLGRLLRLNEAPLDRWQLRLRVVLHEQNVDAQQVEQAVEGRLQDRRDAHLRRGEVRTTL